MPKMYWLETHLGSIDAAVDWINRLGWQLTITADEEQWLIFSGKVDKTILRVASRVLVDTFLYGMGLAYVPLINRLIRELSEKLQNVELNSVEIPIDSDLVIERAKRLLWFLTIFEIENEWIVTTGKQEKFRIFSTTDRHEMDIFLSGMGLAYLSIPDTIFDYVEEEYLKYYKSL